MEAESGVSQNLPNHSLASSVVHSSYSSRGKCLYAGGGEGEGGSFTCARGNVAVMRGCAQVILVMPAAARFLREAFVVLVVYRGKNHRTILENGL